ncbi:MAG: sec-independent protein translocase protein TatA [Verrucomicrobiales bacterium]|jgi:sec-independent protein translocase protein TatA
MLSMFSMPGGAEMMIIAVAVLLLFGAKKLPQLARGMGKAMGEFKSAKREFDDEIRRAEYTVEKEKRELLDDEKSSDKKLESEESKA